MDNTSQYLQQLRQAGVVAIRKKGLKVYYRLSGDDVIRLVASLPTGGHGLVEGLPGPAKTNAVLTRSGRWV